MLGYHDWRDVRNDLVLFYVLGKIAGFCWMVHDWWVFHNGGGSRVLGWVVVHFGWDSKAYEWARWLWMLGRS